MKSVSISLRQNRRSLLLVSILLLGLYVVVPQVGQFRASWQLLLHPRLWSVFVASCLIALTYAAAATTYCLLAFKRLAYGEVLLVQLAAMFVNRLLPGGIGAVGTNYAYLRHTRHSGAQAASVTAVNNLLGFVGHGLIVLAVLLVFPSRDNNFSLGGPHFGSALVLIIAGFGLAAVAALAVVQRNKFQALLTDTARQLLSYRQRPERLLLAIGSSICLTLCNIAALTCCAQALGVSLPFASLVLVFTFGVGAGTVTPTPGGLGGFEVGLAAGLASYHVPGSLALASALLYRLVSYWLPLLVGGVALAICQRRQLFVAAKVAR